MSYIESSESLELITDKHLTVIIMTTFIREVISYNCLR